LILEKCSRKTSSSTFRQTMSGSRMKFRRNFWRFMKRREFAEKRKKFGEKSIDELVELLAAEDLPTRFFAEMCLRDATSV
jgi:hypothetical protein